MKVIIDGCDLVGKSTLIKKLKAYYNNDRMSYLHFSYKDRTDYEFYNMMLDKKDFIADRHFIDEMIYPEVFNREGKLSDIDFMSLLDKCKKEDIKIIILTISQDELLNRSREREEEKEVQENLLKINRKFVELAIEHDLQIFNTTINSFEEIVNYIEGKEKVWTKLK